jgi:DNA repair exonuclease SbcCD ATPase subunit
MKLDALSNDAAGIEDTIEYLQNLLDNTVELTQANADQIKDQIDILLKSIKSSTAAKTKRGERTIEAIESLKTSYRSEIQLLKDIHNRIADLKSELKTLKGVEKDINTQIDFYDGLIKNAKLRNLSTTELKAKRKALQGKVNTIQKLIDGITNAIRKSVNYIKEYVKQVFSAEQNLKKFSDETKFKPLSTKELKDLMDSDLEDDAVFLETYPKLKAEFDRLENDIIENLDTVEMREEVKETEEKRQEELVNALQKYQNQIRYLDELIESYKEVDINKRVRLPSGEFLYEVQQAPKPTVNNQTNKEDTEKTLARQKKEKKESTAKKNEEGIVVSVLKFVQEGPKEAEMTLEELNANLNLETLKLVKSKNYAILFNGVKYKIRRIGKKSVTLYAPEKPDVNVKEAEISSVLEVVEKGEIKATQDEIDLIKSNNELVESTEKELSTTKETLDQLRDAFLNALC